MHEISSHISAQAVSNRILEAADSDSQATQVYGLLELNSESLASHLPSFRWSNPPAVQALDNLLQPESFTNFKSMLIFIEPNDERKPSINQRFGRSELESIRFANKEIEIIHSAELTLVVSAQTYWDALRSILQELLLTEFELLSLEGAVAKNWSTVQSDVSFSHQVGPAEVEQWQRIKHMTEWAASMNAALLLLPEKFSLRNLPSQLSGKIKIRDWFYESLEIDDRLEALEDKVEFCVDRYEIANDRISEFKYFSHESHLEVIIIWILLAELILMIGEIVLTIVLRA